MCLFSHTYPCTAQKALLAAGIDLQKEIRVKSSDIETALTNAFGEAPALQCAENK